MKWHRIQCTSRSRSNTQEDPAAVPESRIVGIKGAEEHRAVQAVEEGVDPSHPLLRVQTVQYLTGRGGVRAR